MNNVHPLFQQALNPLFRQPRFTPEQKLRMNDAVEKILEGNKQILEIAGECEEDVQQGCLKVTDKITSGIGSLLNLVK